MLWWRGEGGGESDVGTVGYVMALERQCRFGFRDMDTAGCRCTGCAEGLERYLMSLLPVWLPAILFLSLLTTCCSVLRLCGTRAVRLYPSIGSATNHTTSLPPHPLFHLLLLLLLHQQSTSIQTTHPFINLHTTQQSLKNPTQSEQSDKKCKCNHWYLQNSSP